MNKLMVGAITLPQATAFWNETRVGAYDRIGRFEDADAQLERRGVDCPAPRRLGSEAFPELRACAQHVAAELRALGSARTAITTWSHHMHAMDQLPRRQDLSHGGHPHVADDVAARRRRAQGVPLRSARGGALRRLWRHRRRPATLGVADGAAGRVADGVAGGVADGVGDVGDGHAVGASSTDRWSRGSGQDNSATTGRSASDARAGPEQLAPARARA